MVLYIQYTIYKKMHVIIYVLSYVLHLIETIYSF